QRRSRRNRRTSRFSGFRVLPPPLAVLVPELRRGSPKRLRREGGCVVRRRVTGTLAERLLAGDPRAIARALSLVEDEDPAAADLVRAVFPRTGHAYLIGVTGPPGAGKSTLVDRLITDLRTQRSQSAQSTKVQELSA